MRVVSCFLALVCLFAAVRAQADEAVYRPGASDVILTPPESPEPKINGPALFGARPGSPVLYRIPATGEEPLRFAAEGLPAGLSLDERSGLIRGTVASPGSYETTLFVRNKRGETKRSFRFEIGDRLALTPPLGWNSWNSWGKRIDADKVLASARALVDSGLAKHGWSYVNIDDTWQGRRENGGPLQPNEKFPDMKALADQVHALGLKLGIYSTPWNQSYAGYAGGSADTPDGAWKRSPDGKRQGAHHFDEADVAQWAAWGIDYLKYDWYPNDREAVARMGAALRKAPRDIVYSLSNSALFEEAEFYRASANLWRTTGDITDAWHLAEPKQSRQGIVNIWQQHLQWAPHNGPGHWNDPDMLVLGRLGWGGELRPTQLTRDEQYSHFSLWCLWSAPLILGCPLDGLDEFTRSLLRNDEVLDIDQDPLGKQAAEYAPDAQTRVVFKELADGSKAVGLFNLGTSPAVLRVEWKRLGLQGSQSVRDAWRQVDLGSHSEGFSAEVSAHGVVLLRVRPAVGSTVNAEAETGACLVLASDFQYPGSWLLQSKNGSLAARILRGSEGEKSALTAVSLPEGGTYSVWVRSVDFPDDRPGERHYAVALNGTALPREGGKHGRRDWAWERLGTVVLPAGDTAIELRNTSRSFSRCDAVLLTRKAAFDPETLAKTELLKLRRMPLKLAFVDGAKSGGPRAQATVQEAPRSEVKTVGVIEARSLRMRFEQAGTTVRRSTELRLPGAAENWVAIPSSGEAETLSVLYSAEKNVEAGQLEPRWRNASSERTVRIAGKTYAVEGGAPGNPFQAAPLRVLTAREARPVSGGGIELSFSDAEGKLKASVLWRLSPEGDDFEVSATLDAWADGFYSVAAAPFPARPVEERRFVLLPPLYQFQRLPQAPSLLPSSVTPQALALVELAPDKTLPSVSYGVAAAPDDLPFEWPSSENARYGFSLLSEEGLLQPTVFRPVLGLGDSRWKAGEAHTLRWRVFARAGDWRPAFDYAATRLFRVTDYRHPVGASLTEAARAMIALMADEEHGGWSGKLKGFWNIEAPSVASQSAPLALLSAAVLTEDEDFYVRRALPTLEYTLSRPGPHFATQVPKTEPVYVDDKALRLVQGIRFFGASYWQGVDGLLGRANPWAAHLARKTAELPPVQKWVPEFSQTLALYRLKPEPALLKKAVQEATAWVAKEIDGRKAEDLGYTPFYNHHFIPVWWDLVALYELTHDKRWLEAARSGGLLTVAGLRSNPQPTAPEADLTIYRGGSFNKTAHVWWKDAELFRLGWPRREGDTPSHAVQSWKVSPVGLGLEQPSTFFGGGKAGEQEGFQNILMSAWAPGLLRLSALTGETVFRDYARNGVIGRFSNYPGYYLRGFSDLQQTPAYPTRGPDVTSLYYHHIPVQLAFTLDWLFAEAELRSGGAVRFPWAQQTGYVWFNNRIYGQTGGEVFGEKNLRPCLPKAVNVADPGLNWLAARGERRLWLVLMNDAPEPRPAAIALDGKALGLKEGAPVVVRFPGEGKPLSCEAGALASTVSVPPRGLVALGYSREPEAPQLKFGPIAAKPLSLDTGTVWGRVLAWRLRSPFGRDSLYVCLDGRPSPGATASLLVDGKPALRREATEYPYEFSLYPLEPDSPLVCHLELQTAEGKVLTLPAFTLPGARRED